jgi:thiol-disulfide isomerase/thioredoxin
MVENRNIFWLLFVVCCLLFSVSSSAQKVNITGEAKPYKGKLIQAIVYEDYITNTEKVLAEATVNDSGNFQLSFDVNKIEYVFLKSENAIADLHVEPDKSYDVILFPKDSTRYTNPNSEQLVDLAILKTDTNELNYLKADFNRMFDEFWENNYQYFVANKFSYDRTDSFRLAVQKRYDKTDNPYFKTYIKYKIASLEASTEKSGKVLFKNYIDSLPFLYGSYEYMAFINKFFGPSVYNLMMKEEYADAINRKAVFKNFVKLIKIDKMSMNDTVREFVAIKSLYNSYNYPLFRNENIVYLLQTASKEAIHPGNRLIASNMLRKINRLIKGSPAPDFLLADKNEKLVSLKDFRGKYVYVDFWATWCVPCMAEMKLMPDLKKEYGSKIEFVSISIDDNIGLMKQFLKKNPQYNWTFLYAGDKSRTKEEYMVYSVPAYYLINPNGNLYQSPAGIPSGEIEKVFDKIVKKEKK